MGKQNKTEKLLEGLFYISARARKYASWIKNESMVEQILDYTLLLENHIRGENEKS